MQAVCTHVQSSIFNRVGPTGKSWTIDQVILSVASGQDTYTLNVGSEFGRAIDVYTYDPSNPSHIERSIPFWNIQDMHFNWGYPNNVASSFLTPDGSPNTATRIAFYRNNVGDVSVKVAPIPMLNANYQVLFSIGNFIDTAGLDSSPLLSEFHMLPEVRAAISLLPQTEWHDGDNSGQRKEFATALKNDEAIFIRDFENAIRNQVNSKMGLVYTMSID